MCDCKDGKLCGYHERKYRETQAAQKSRTGLPWSVTPYVIDETKAARLEKSVG